MPRTDDLANVEEPVVAGARSGSATVPTARTRPEYSRSRINAAGAALIDPASSLNDLRRTRAIVNNWRAAHSLPLDHVRTELQERVAPFGEEALVAQRLKRLSSIDAKLRRFRNMNLARMQDVGGCRAVLPSVDDVRRVARSYEDRPPRHRVVHTDDYLARPRSSGYRGIHLVSRFQPGEEEEAFYAGMRLEIQLRSRLQHAWAAAVETVGTFSGQALKSSEGDHGWLRFFALMASEIAFSEECPVVPDTADSRDALRHELAVTASALGAVARLERYRQALKILEGHVRNGQAEYFHIVAESWQDGTARVRWNEYAGDEREEAIRAFEEVEAAIEHFPGAETVLVRVASVEALRSAYPSYFADTRAFVAELEKAIA